ncbi:MAG: phosphoglucomutase/phosphomannomutase family protein [Moorellales bacterium]
MNIKFGTDGWRGIIADDFTFDGVARVTQAIASYLQPEGEGRPVIVGYDCRFLAEDFAARAAEVLAGNGFTVLMADRPTPTPVVAFGVRHYQAAGGIMITASHNPAAYCGLKFIPAYAGPAFSSVTEAVEARLQTATSPRLLSRSEAERRGRWQEIDLREAYFSHLRSLVRPAPARRLKIIVDAMYGTGSGYADDFLAEMGFQVQLLHGERDPFFGGRSPDPLPANLGALIEAVTREGADLGLALDGDADRFGVVDATGAVWSANKVLALLLHHLLQSRNWQQGEVVRTVATTHMLDALAQRFGLTLTETPVGFKHVAERLLAGALFGGEESGGLSVAGHVPEKDGILAACLLAEMVATCGSLTTCQRILAQHIRLKENRRWDLALPPEGKERLLRALAEYRPAEIAGLMVLERRQEDGLKLLLEDENWVLVRPSGTEPVVRLYVESPETNRLEPIARAVAKELGIGGWE